MLRSQSQPHPSSRRGLALCAIALALFSNAALAAPADTTSNTHTTTGDSILQFLQERHLVPASPERVLKQARDLASELVVSAMGLLGVPYRRGGNSIDEGFDCSGFTRHIFESSIGLWLPRRADQQALVAGLAPVERTELRPGDLVFFNTMKRAFSHVGIYMGDGKFIHAPRSGAQVRIEDMRETYWTRRYNGARRADAVVASAAQSLPANTRP